MLILQIRLQLLLQRPISRFPQSECLCDSGNDQVGIVDGGQWNEADPISKVIEQACRDLEAQACFANATGAGKSEQAHLWLPQQSTYCCYLLLATNKGGEGGRHLPRGPGEVTNPFA